MAWNILLVLLLFGIPKKKLNPYLSAGIIGGIKAVLYLVFAQSVLMAVIIGPIFFLLAAGFVYFLERIDKQEIAEQLQRAPGARPKTGKFRWEYIPVTGCVVLLIFGEVLLL